MYACNQQTTSIYVTIAINTQVYSYVLYAFAHTPHTNVHTQSRHTYTYIHTNTHIHIQSTHTYVHTYSYEHTCTYT